MNNITTLLRRCHPTSSSAPSAPVIAAAPMVWHSDNAYRQMVHSNGVDVVWTPMYHATAIVTSPLCRALVLNDLRSGHNDTNSDILNHRHRIPVVLQLCGTSPEHFSSAASIVEHDCDAIDLNLGCPQITAKVSGFGAYLMDSPDRVSEIIQAGVAATRKPIFAKIRILDSLDDTLNFVRMLESSGVSLITVHGRKRDRTAHNGPVDWDAIRAIKNAVSVPVFANGGVKSHTDAITISEYTGSDGVMVGTGLHSNPRMFAFSPTVQSNVAPLEITFEYMKWCSSYPPTHPKFIRNHIVSWLSDYLINYIDLEHMIKRNRACCTYEQYMEILRILQHRLVRDAVISSAVTEDDRELMSLHDVKNLHAANQNALYSIWGERGYNNDALAIDNTIDNINQIYCA